MNDTCLLSDHARDPMFRRWVTLCSGLGWDVGGQAYFETLARHYAVPPRAYHNLNHIAHCLDEFTRLRHLTSQAPLVELVIWFHDAVYDARANDNEERSAALAEAALARLGLCEADRGEVARLIRVTTHQIVLTDMNACLVSDVDLAILGQPVEAFDLYEAQIREEYHWVHDREYVRGRVSVLERFLARDQIYSIPEMRERYEAKARGNLRCSIARLRSSIAS